MEYLPKTVLMSKSNGWIPYGEQMNPLRCTFSAQKAGVHIEGTVQ
jgi:hypothetical protein